MDIERLIHSGQLPTPPPDAPVAMNPPGVDGGGVDGGSAWTSPRWALPPGDNDDDATSSEPVSPGHRYILMNNSSKELPASNDIGGVPNHRTPTVDDFRLLKVLGTGTFSKVWLVKEKAAENHVNPTFYALKQLRKPDVIRLKQIEHIRNEKKILELCQNHPFITSFISSWQDHCSLYILLEYSPGGEMFGYLRRSRNFEPAVAQFYAAEIALILVFLHGHGVVYRDLKPENILFDARGHVKLVDFGFAKVVGDRETYTLCGTPEYLSPEVIQSKGHGKAVDWWALGVLIYEMILGYPPFYDNSPIKIYEKIVTGRISFPAWLPPDTKDIIQRLCTKDLSSRLGNMKGGGYEVMMHPFFRGINWRDLERQMHQGPFVPQLRFPGDTQYFEQYDVTGPGSDEEYTDAMFKEYDKLFEGF